jgi:hypothetical protein
VAIEAIPDGYREVVTGRSALSRWLRLGRGTLFVMEWHDETIRCAAMSFEAHVADATITGTLQEPGSTRELAFRYREASPGGTATLAAVGVDATDLADVVFVVGSTDDEAHVLRGPIVPGAHFYREAEAERWFAASSACEAAAQEARSRLAADGREMLSLGLHEPLFFSLYWRYSARSASSK